MIAFVTTCKGRAQHLKLTLPKNLADNADYPNCKFIVLDFSSQDDLIPYLLDCHSKEIKSGKLIVYSFRGAERFEMSRAKNMAARCAILEGADILVTLDADNCTGEGFAQFVADKFSEPRIWPGMFLCPDFPLIQSLPHGPDRPKRGYAGRLAIRAHDFIKAGGYDEAFDTWRGEDIDMIFRLQRMGYTQQHIPNRYLNAISHNAEVRFAEYPEAQKYETKQEYHTIKSGRNTIVNWGKIGCGVVYKNFGDEPIELNPLPTRVFGIGMHKTATTSLHAAFEILGYDSLHWGTGEAPRIWYEMNSTGQSQTLEQWYTVSDLPVPLLYQKLDKAYPGSKFVLTMRNEEKWLTSVSRLFDARYNPTKWVWDRYPFTNRIHEALYGQRDFDPGVFLARYRKHNAEVGEYFKDRPDDLLVLDMDGANGKGSVGSHWAQLCSFLGCKVPREDYPVEFRTKRL